VDLDEWLAANHGVVRRRDLVRRGISDATIRQLIKSAGWQRAFRGVIVTDAATEAPDRVRCRAALLAAGDGAYLSCLGAAIHRGLPVAAGTAVHVSVQASRVVAHQVGLRGHRNGLDEPPSEYAGLPAVGIEAALIESFGCLDVVRERRALVIESIRQRLVTADRVLAAIPAGAHRRPELIALLEVCAGSESEAEIAMLLLMRTSRLPEPVRQHRVTAVGRKYRIDLAYPDCLLAIEVDGKAWHFNAPQRAADIRRDAALAAAGWLTLRFTYEQIATDPSWVVTCVREALARRTKIS
jgi:very-short-patch-repair endonuclease